MSPWHRTYFSIFFANLITAVGMMSFLPFFPTLLESVGVTDRNELELWSGIIAGAAPLMAALMGPVWGSLGDRVGRKAMVLRAIFGITIFVGLLGFARSPVELLLLRLCQGTFSGFVPPSITLVSVQTPRENQGRVTGSLQMALPAGMILGPLVGAALQERYGIQSVFLFVALASGFAGLMVALFAHEDASLRDSYERFSPGAVLGGAWFDLVRMLRQPTIRFAFLALFFVQFGAGAINPLLELAVRDRWTGDPDGIADATAYLFSGYAVMGLLTTTGWGWAVDRFGSRRTLFVSSIATGIALAAHAGAGFYALLFTARLAHGATSAGSSVSAFGVATTESSYEDRGRAISAVFSARALAWALGSATGGMLAALIGLDGLFLAAGAVILIAMLFLRAPRRATVAEG
ncbi:MAG: MFS transporter, partial [Planctomycetota bacterium]